MGNWHFVDIPRNRQIQLPAPSCSTPATRSSCRDFVWMGIRKGGERWVTLDFDSVWQLSFWRPQPSTGQPLYSFTLTSPTIPGTWNPLGLTHDKKTFVISSRDSSGTQPDQLSFFDVQGNLLREAPCSDAPDRVNSRLTYLEHDYYVLSRVGGDAPWYVKVYDARATLIRSFNIASVSATEECRGITTDGKYLYIIVTRDSSHVSDRILKFDVRGVEVRNAWNVGDNREYLNGITFNGLYLLVAKDASPPSSPL